ncbi:hypothetical protein YPPY92_3107, partial [Yersinia pestis PY-92]
MNRGWVPSLVYQPVIQASESS